jgi:hypothetical protein
MTTGRKRKRKEFSLDINRNQAILFDSFYLKKKILGYFYTEITTK